MGASGRCRRYIGVRLDEEIHDSMRRGRLVMGIARVCRWYSGEDSGYRVVCYPCDIVKEGGGKRGSRVDS